MSRPRQINIKTSSMVLMHDSCVSKKVKQLTKSSNTKEILQNLQFPNKQTTHQTMPTPKKKTQKTPLEASTVAPCGHCMQSDRRNRAPRSTTSQIGSSSLQMSLEEQGSDRSGGALIRLGLICFSSGVSV